MTPGTRVRDADLYREFGARNADTVIAPRIHDHVGLRRHMTFYTSRAGRPGLVEMVPRGIVFVRRMALKTNPVAFHSKLQTMRLVAIAAGHPSVEHPALDERTVLVYLIPNLSVWIVKIVVKERDPRVIPDWLAMHVVFMNLASP